MISAVWRLDSLKSQPTQGKLKQARQNSPTSSHIQLGIGKTIEMFVKASIPFYQLLNYLQGPGSQNQPDMGNLNETLSLYQYSS
jgi:hypothetical protein